MRLSIPSEMLEAIIGHLASALPEEGCGLLATVEHDDGLRTSSRFYPGENIDHSTTRFTMNPTEVFAALQEMEAMNWKWGAIVHSHPRTPPHPSATDLREAYYPDAWMVIVSFATDDPEIAVWRVNTESGIPDPVRIPLQVL